jgi:lysozyme
VATPKRTPKKKSPIKRKPAPKRAGWKFFIITALLLILLSPFYYGYVLKTFSSTWQWLRDAGSKPRYRSYKSFNIDIPSGYTIHGIDVSYAQGRINWQKVKIMRDDSVHITFAYIKATEGLLKVDPYFKRNWREGPKAGIICGAYHFLRPNKNGLWQARFFLQNVSMEAGDLPPVVDIETLDGTTPEAMRKQLQAFLTYVENKAHTRPVIYTQLSYYADYLAGYFDSYPTWIARYNPDDIEITQHSNWEFWQHSDRASVNGIGHTVDFDAFKGDSLAFRQLLIQ